ncbi:MAG: hypothetical protein FJ134_00680 [Deltaproteobacteria bacterium]|nr:hypothetical protein [Deltaproteobacteria bacterium]
MIFSALRLFLAGLAGGLALNLLMLFTFRLLGFGWQGGGVLLNPSLQSPKLIAVWTQLEPLPLVVSQPAPIIIGLFGFTLGHAYLYQWLAPGWPAGIAARGLRLGGLIFFLSFLFWEFFTPFNQFGEPLLLIGLQLIFWAVIAAGEGLAIAAVMEKVK